MAVRTISTRLAIEGESAYRSALKNINAELQLHKSELSKVEARYKESANSLTALESKEAALKGVLSGLSAKYSEHSGMLEKAQQAQKQYVYQVEQSSGKLERAKAKLEELKKSTSDTSTQQAKLTAEVEKHKKALAAAEAKQQKATNSVTYYQKQINNVERDQANFDLELKKTEQYLDEARNSTDQCATSIDKYGKEVKQVQQKTADANQTIGALAAALAAGGLKIAFEKATEAIKACVNASIEFESAVTGVFKTVDGTDAQLAAISDGIKQMSTEIPATTTEIAAVAEAAGQLGIATNDVLSFSRVMLDLGESTNLSADEAATALARFANITGTSAADYERLGSVIVGLGNNFATTESEITGMATRLASAGTLAGLTESEIIALAAAMSSVGIEAEAGGTAMTQTLTAMEKAVSKGGEDLGQFARIAGMSASEFKTAWENDAITAVQAFITGLGKLDEQGESATLILDELGLSGIRQSNMLKSLALASDTLTGAVGLANQAWIENTALAEEANKRYETTESKLAMMNNAFTNVKASIGDALTPALGDVADAGTDAFSWAAEFIEQNPWLVSAISGVAAALGVLTVAVAGYTVAVNVIIPLVKAFNAALASNPISMVALAVSTLVAAVGTFAATLPRASEEVLALKNSLEESRKAYEDTQAALSEQKDSTLATAAAIESLAGKEHRTTAEKETLLALVKQLNEEVPGLNLAYNSLDDTMNMTTEDIQAMVRAMAEQEEREAGIQRLAELRREQMLIENDLAAAEDALAEAEAAKNEMVEKGIYWMMGYESQSQEVDAALAEAAKSVRELTAEQDTNNQAMEDANEAYGSLQSSTENAGDTAKSTAEQIAELTEKSEELTDKTRDLSDEVDMLSSALKEQKEKGSLSLDTTLELIDAGYAAALSIDQETGAVTLNKEEYVKNAQSKIDAQIASLTSQKASVDAAIANETEARSANDVAQQYYKKAKATVDSANATVKAKEAEKNGNIEALQAQSKSYDAQIKALEQAKKGLGSYSSASTSAAKTSASSSRKMQTQAEKDLSKYKELRSALDHSLAMGEITEKEYYETLAKYRDQYLTDDANLSEYRKINEEIHKYDQKLAEDEKKLWEEQTGELVSELEDRFNAVMDKQSKMMEKLAGYGDLFTIEDDVMSLENLQEQTKAIQDYGDTLRQLKDNGVTGDLLNEIVNMGVDEGAQYGQMLNSMAPEKLAEYIDTWEEKQAEAKRIAEEFYSDELKTLETEFKDKLDGALDPAVQAAFTNGQEIDQAIIDGLSDKEAEIYRKVSGIVREMERIFSSTSLSMDTVDGSHAGGLPYVPFDGYVAELHQGERVLTKEEAQDYIARSIPSRLELPAANTRSDIGSMLSQAVNAMGTAAADRDRYVIELHMDVNGKEFYRETIDDFRAVSKSNPEVVSDG